MGNDRIVELFFDHVKSPGRAWKVRFESNRVQRHLIYLPSRFTCAQWHLPIMAHSARKTFARKIHQRSGPFDITHKTILLRSSPSQYDNEPGWPPNSLAEGLTCCVRLHLLPSSQAIDREVLTSVERARLPSLASATKSSKQRLVMSMQCASINRRRSGRLMEVHQYQCR